LGVAVTPSRRPDYLMGVLAVFLALGCAWSARRSGAFVEEPVSVPVATARGERVFVQYCHRCHSGGEADLAPGLTNEPLPASRIARLVRQGSGTMPAFPSAAIDDGALTDLVGYLVALRERRPQSRETP
jgi:mono/diheme cytochrome c family protein